ncbi:phosphoribosylanthranilate isomerase [Desulfobulbus oligotrophicus]|uniref:N-(5'-phosphoribosyl)anthranilate isomerase n=1 Tax=Desulfobulbus oligotrophicus TaxID=1909699 RepID=A0A7T6AR06_9BACT|nr:phosphoribosylanthranilate isomerase [Desulfobulbus oligotrophicus]QQG66050.1 phosphoribosylanthranilate isomerase [Desulfobulbus oligotrophicus]
MSAPDRIRIKICGMTRLADALCAATAGVDALGFIFYEKSPRAVSLSAAKDIIRQLPPLVAAVGVFVDEKLEQVVRTVRACGLTHVQLHGAEPPDYCRQLADSAASCRIIKAVRVGTHSTSADITPYRTAVHGYLLDTYEHSRAGGTGQRFDWSLIDQLQLDRPFFLAGGLDLKNIRVALKQVTPYGVDANSGLEDAPGLKNHHRIHSFITTVRGFECERLASQQ